MGNPSNFAAFCGIARENTAGIPVKSLHELDFISETLHGQGEPLRRRTINRKRAVKGAVQGGYSAEGDLNLEATPDKISQLLYAAFTNLNTTGSGEPYTHVFKPGNTLLPLSVQVKRQEQYFVYPGQYVNRLTWRGVVDAILEMTAGLQGRAKEKIYDAEQSDAGITASELDPFVFWGATCSLHGGASTDTNNWELSAQTGLTRHKGIGAGRAHNQAHPGDSQVTGSFDVVFDTIEEHRRWMGAAASTYPIDVANTLQTFAAQLKYVSGVYELQFDLPKAYYKASAPAVSGREGLIMQRCEFETLWDEDEDCDLKITLVNNEANSVVVATGVNI